MITPGHYVCIVDDDEAMGDSLRLLLETAGCIVTLYQSGEAFLLSDLRRLSGCVLLDVRMPGKDGLTVLSEALKINPNLVVVMISGHGDIPMAVEALKLGALNFIEKPFQAKVILESVERACALIDCTDKEFSERSKAKSLIAKLTPRELEVTEKLVEGKSNKIVAFEMGVSTRTVETHRARVLSKLQVRSLADIVKLHLAATSVR